MTYNYVNISTPILFDDSKKKKKNVHLTCISIYAPHESMCACVKLTILQLIVTVNATCQKQQVLTPIVAFIPRSNAN